MSPGGPPRASVDEVREHLRQLGYLESGLDRFVLGGAGGAGLAASALRAALRVGLLAGLVFGAALTLAAASLDTRLLAAPSDLAVLDEALAARFPLRTIATYETGARAGAAAGSGDVDEKVMEDLRALGYIEAREK